MIKDMEELNRIIAADMDGVEAQVFAVVIETWADCLQGIVERVYLSGAYVTAAELKAIAQGLAKEYGFLVEGDEIVTGIDHDEREARLRDKQPEPVAVRRLDWDEIHTHGGRKIYAKSHGMEWRLDPTSRTLAEDKAKAQAQFDAHIRSALA